MNPKNDKRLNLNALVAYRITFYIVLAIFLNIFFWPRATQANDTISTRFSVPEGFVREHTVKGTFAYYLQNLPLLPKDSDVVYFNGAVKNTDSHVAVINLDVGNKDLQQCADAVIRLRAEFLFEQKAFEEIHFNFTNGFKADFNSWKNGGRLGIKGNKTWWKENSAPKDDSYESFRKYLDLVFTYAGTISLSNELKPTTIENASIGDVFIQAGSPGHAMIIVDKAVKGNEVVVLLAQSYMPAQSIHIVINPLNASLSPWIVLGETQKLITPDWHFEWNDLKSF